MKKISLLFVLLPLVTLGSSFTTFQIAAGEDSFFEQTGLPYDNYKKYTSKYGKTYYYKDNDGFYDDKGNMLIELYEYAVVGIADEGSDIAVVTLYGRQPVGTSKYNCGGYGITIIDQTTNTEKNSLFGFDDVKISKGNKVFFNTVIAKKPVKLSFEDIIKCKDYYEDSLEYLYKQH